MTENEFIENIADVDVKPTDKEAELLALEKVTITNDFGLFAYTHKDGTKVFENYRAIYPYKDNNDEGFCGPVMKMEQKILLVKGQEYILFKHTHEHQRYDKGEGSSHIDINVGSYEKKEPNASLAIYYSHEIPQFKNKKANAAKHISDALKEKMPDLYEKLGKGVFEKYISIDTPLKDVIKKSVQSRQKRDVSASKMSFMKALDSWSESK